MASNYEVGRLEIVIETATKKANQELDKLISKLNQVSTSLKSVAASAQQINKANEAISRTTAKAQRAGAATKKMAEELKTSSNSFVNTSAIERMELRKKYKDLNAVLMLYGKMGTQNKLLIAPQTGMNGNYAVQIRNATDSYREFTQQAYDTHQAEQERIRSTREQWEAFLKTLRDAMDRMKLMSDTYGELRDKTMDYDGALATSMNSIVKLRGAVQDYHNAMAGVTDITSTSEAKQLEISEAYKKVANAATEAAAAQEILKAAELRSGKSFAMSSLINKDINKEMAQFNAEYSKVRYNAKEVNQEITKHSSGMGTANSALLKLRRTMLNIISLVYLIRKGWKYISRALDFGETINLFQTVFRKLGLDAGEEFEFAFLERATEFRDKLGSVLSLDPNELMNYMSNFAQMANSMGVVSESAYRMSESLTLLGADVASLFNVDIDTSMQRLRAGLSGQIRPMRMMGVDISKTTLQMTALKYGIADSIETMDAAAKVQLRYLAMTEQLTIAMGDMARTIDNPANQLRILQQQWVNFTRNIGTVFVPLISKILPVLNGLVMALGQLAGTLADAVGYVDPDFTDETIYALGDLEEQVDDTDESIQRLRATLGGFDELNIISETGNMSDKLGSGYAVLDEAIMKSNEFYMNALNEQMETMSNKAKEWRETFLRIIPVISTITSLLVGLVVAVKTLSKLGGIMTVFGAAGGGVQGLGKAVPMFGKISTAIKGIGGAFKALGGFLVANPIVAIIALIVAALVALYTTNENFRNSINNLFKQLKPLIDAFIGGFNIIWTALMPIFNGLSAAWKIFGDTLAQVINFIIPIVTFFVGIVSNQITLIATILSGIIDYIVGVFTGDWELAWSGVVKVFSGIWNSLVNTFNLFVDLLQPVIDFFVEAFTNMWEGLKSFIGGVFDFIGNAWRALWTGIENFINGTVNTIVAIIEGIIAFYIKLFTEPKQLLDDTVKFIKGIFDDIVRTIVKTVDKIMSVFEPVALFFVSMWDGLVSGLQSAWDFISNIFSGIGDWFGDIKDGVGEVFKDLINELIGGINAVMKAPFEAINGILENIRDISILGAKPFSWIGTVPVPQIPKLAEGGIVDYGQLFVAREAGAELVGSFGGQTGVMNNEQIVDAVSAGVANAVAQVMGQMGSDNGERNINVFLDGRQISTAVEQNRRQRGVSIVRGGDR